jgi:hypothetical protein
MKTVLGVTLVAIGLLTGTAARAEDSVVCKELSTALATFAGAATGYQLVYVYGGPSGWVAAGLYAVGAGLAAAGVKTSSEAICEDLEAVLEEVGESYVRLACSTSGTCGDVHYFAQSLAHDFAVCPSCTPDEILGAAFMRDDQRENYLRRLQRQRNPDLAGFSVIPRDHIGRVDGSVTMSYFLGLRDGKQQRYFNRFAIPVL